MIWIVMILTGLANFAVRFSMFSGLRARTLPDWAERYLRYVPTAVLSAIIAAALFLDEAGDIQMWNTTVLAGLLAAIIGVKALCRERLPRCSSKRMFFAPRVTSTPWKPATWRFTTSKFVICCARVRCTARDTALSTLRRVAARQ